MNEFELKLEIPADRLEAVVAAVQEAPTRRLRLRAVYLDTADRALARAGIALRLRQEGRRWVQTAKGLGKGPVERLEHNVELATTREKTPPQADLARHDGTPLGERCRAALGLAAGEAPPALEPVFETDVERLLREVRLGDSTLELALDQGRITAAGRKQAVRELEVELKEGKPQDAVLLARHWAVEHGLWLSSISKAQRGWQLAEGRLAGPAVQAQAPDYGRGASRGEMTAAVLGACLAQAIANASEIAGGSNANDHVHQLRVGIRRLRTALRELQVLQPLDGSGEPALVQAFRVLGEHRDRVHVVQAVAPRLEAAGGPVLDLQALPAPPDPGEAVRAPAFQDALLGLLLQQLDAQSAGGRPRKRIVKALRRLWRQVTGDGRKFTELEQARQHRVRKRLKRLRYLAEFAAPLLGPQRVRGLVADLKPVQDALGLYNDELMARSVWQEFSQTEPRAWFGVGWLDARREPHAQDCRKTLRRLARSRPFWD